jgi:hypothetical protein
LISTLKKDGLKVKIKNTKDIIQDNDYAKKTIYCDSNKAAGRLNVFVFQKIKEIFNPYSYEGLSFKYLYGTSILM